jgi:hypothetical protein
MPAELEITEYAIGGKLVEYYWRVDPLKVGFNNMSKEDVKRKLVEGLVELIIDQKLVETTYEHDRFAGEQIYRARMYLAPDAQIKILRVLKNDSKYTGR